MVDTDLEGRVAALESAVEQWARQRASRDEGAGSVGSGCSRRTFLQGLGVAGLGSYAIGQASADPQGQLGTSNDPVKTVYTQALAGGLTGGTNVSSLLGSGLSLDNGSLTADITGAENLGTGDGLYSDVTNGSIRFRSLQGGQNVTLSKASDTITVDATSAGEANTASNVGSGTGAFKQKAGTDLEFKSLVGGSNLSISSGSDTLTLDASATYPSVSDNGSSVRSGASDVNFGSNLSVTDDADGTVTVDASSSGETNTASNVGTGKGTFKTKTGSDLEFKSLVGGSNLSISAGTDELTLDASATYPSVSDGGTAVLSGASDVNFGSNLSVTDDTDGTVTVDATTAGESNTASNVGTGSEWFKQKSGADLEFRTLVTQGALSATQNTDEVSIGGPWADPDADTLLEPRSGTGYTGIDLSGVSGAQVVTPWVGTSTASAFETYVNGTRAARFGTTGSDLNTNTAAGNVLLGQYGQVADSAVGVAVGGGGSPTNSNENVGYDDYSTIGGGMNNQAGSSDADSTTAPYTTVGGGNGNTAKSRGSTVGGGEANTAKGDDQATVAGGYNNTASGWRAAVGGGNTNTTSNAEATIAGGKQNNVEGAWATIGGGQSNNVFDDDGTVSGGNGNQAGTDDSDPTTARYSSVGGGQNNTASGVSSTVAGGSGSTASGQDSTVGGGSANTASVKGSTVAGGVSNVAKGNDQATVGGGYQNTASEFQATVAGGKNNTASGSEATVAGGNGNTASGYVSTVPGGLNNTASGTHSFAAGRAATADNNGAFVFGDSTSNTVSSSSADQFVVQAGGGTTIYSSSDTSQNNGVQLASGSGSWSSLSTAAAKSNFESVDTSRVLDRVTDLDVRQWEYTAEADGVTHMGPIAEQFHAAFGLGPDDDHIVNVDADGVAFAAIQGLVERIDDLKASVAADDDAEAARAAQDERIETLQSAVAERDERIDDLEADLAEKDDRIDDLESRLAALERAVGAGD